ncbi:phage protein [Lactobacillus hamsteri DSM 5661 = JCM 6256]|uniref:Phage protein n=1 Tax=Lactobacillus hamsteri DSM 5661 = JCM 6256 TaxID=1423754 RepID=A0A0R1Y437_9LACO|nr:phage protein [Lactobacillus hamsteri DSM 5661 = JCM 6256]
MFALNDELFTEEDDELDFDETGFEGEESILEIDEEEAQIDNGQVEDDPTLTFQVYHGRIRNKFDGLAAMEQAVDKILRTERFIYPIYSDQYGNDLPELIGKNISYAKTECERMIIEALIDDDRVTEVDIQTIDLIETDTLMVRGVCHTVYGDIPIKEEVGLSNES